MFLNIASDSIVLINPKTKKFVEYNQNARQRLDYTRKEFVKLTLTDIDTINSASASTQYTQKIINRIRSRIALFQAQYKYKHETVYDVQVKAKTIFLSKKIHPSVHGESSRSTGPKNDLTIDQLE